MALITGETDVRIDDEAEIVDGTNQNSLLGAYGEMFTLEAAIAPDIQALQCSRYQALTAPAVAPAGVAMGIQTAFSDTANITFILVNGAAAGGKRIIMDYILVRITAAGTTTTSAEAAWEIDSTNRYSSGGTALTPGLTSTDSNVASVASQCRYSAITAAAAGANRRWQWQRLIRKAAAPVWIVGDQVLFVFGPIGAFNSANASVVSSTDANGTNYIWSVPPSVIGPGGSGLLHIVNPANATTAPSISVEAGWYEY